MPGDGEVWGGFPTTRWSLVDRVRQEDPTGRRPSLAALLDQYLPALRAHLIRRKRMTPDAVDDLLQNFVTEKILEKALIAKSDQTRGKFRTFLLTTLDRYLISAGRHARAQKRSAGRGPLLDIDEQRDACVDHAGPTDVFDQAWAQQVVAEALKRMQAACARDGRQDLWALFDCRLAGPLLRDEAELPYEQVIARFGFKSYSQATKAMTCVKRRYIDQLRQVVAEYAGLDGQVEEELADLRRILSA